MRASERRAIERCVCEVWYVYAGWPVGAHRRRPGTVRLEAASSQREDVVTLAHAWASVQRLDLVSTFTVTLLFFNNNFIILYYNYFMIIFLMILFLPC